MSFTDLNEGLLAAIVIVFVGLIIMGCILLCMFGCCLKRRTTRLWRRAQRSRGAVHMNVNPPAASLQACYQLLPSDPELPKYHVAVTEGPDSSAPPPYKE